MNAWERFKLRRRKRNESRYFDYSLLVVVIFLIGFGLLMIFSASSYESTLSFGDPTYYLKRQSIALAFGAFAMTLTTVISYRVWQRFPYWFYYGIACVLLLLLLVPGLGIERNGATRWLKMFGGLNLQPAEVAKTCMIVFYAKFITEYHYLTKSWKGLGVLIGSVFPVSFLIYVISDNLSSAIIVFAIVFCMVFVSAEDRKKVWLIIGGGVLTIATLVGGVLLFVNPDSTASFRFRRIFAWIHPENYADGVGFQTLQSLYAIGSGGVFGKGLGASMQKLNYIPEAQNDMIFSIICEELGFVGGLAVIALFIVMFWRFMVICNNTKDYFGAMLVVGVMAHFSIQVVLNIAVVTNLIPNTGISLPFISYGGSSMMFLMAEIGLVLSVAKGIRFDD